MSLTQAATANDGLSAARKQKAGTPGAVFPFSLIRRIQEYRRCQRDYQHLLSLPDHLLRDIGLTRQDIIKARRRRLL